MSPSRSAFVLASAAEGIPGPVDGVTGDLGDDGLLAHDGLLADDGPLAQDGLLADDIAYARRLGFAGKLCVRLRQVAVAARALRPGEDEVRWATSVIDAASGRGAVAVDGQIVDKPVLDRARRILLSEGITQ